ncbi:DNA-directed RNA polymerase subunit beta [Gracilibacillus sp. D59]|uniref:DNA-directed RNA polymerase subunit beta n=1 Tax=Gracilibacillus sp. D59 TaxID=3457434 RepID=UPI003FCDF9EC
MSQETKSKNKNADKANEQKKAQSNTKSEKRAEKKKQKQKEKKYIRRVVPIWAKVLIVVVSSLFALMIGLIVGFSMLGDGHPIDVLKWETWQHIIDFVQVEK